MSVADLLRHDLVIRRLAEPSFTAGTPASVVLDAWGHSATYTAGTPPEITVRTYGDHHRVRGLVQERKGEEVQGPELQGTVVSNAVIFLPFGTDVTTRDRVRSLDDGAEYDILYVKDAAGQRHHLELTARRINP